MAEKPPVLRMLHPLVRFDLGRKGDFWRMASSAGPIYSRAGVLASWGPGNLGARLWVTSDTTSSVLRRIWETIRGLILVWTENLGALPAILTMRCMQNVSLHRNLFTYLPISAAQLPHVGI